MKKPQWITIAASILLVAAIYSFGRTTPPKKTIAAVENHEHGPNDGHNHANEAGGITIDTILQLAKKQLTIEQTTRLAFLENSITRGDVHSQKMEVYHQLSHFWGDSMRFFAPYAWYEAEAARLENSEKTLTFAARLFLDNLQHEENQAVKKWEALQAKDLFERSLKINPDNDSAKVGLGACYLFGNISANPMEGIMKIREVTEKDSTNTYAQLMLVQGSLISGQYDKAIGRLQTVLNLHPENLEAILILAEVYERTGKKAEAIDWYKKSLLQVKRPDAKAAIEKRIEDLRK